MTTPTFTHVPKAVLYHFTPGSVWSSVPSLTALEKGFTEVQLEQRIVNLVEGQNFAPSFLKRTVPVLVAPYSHTVTSDLATKFRALTSTVEICDFLDHSTNGPSAHSAPSLSPATVEGAIASSFIVDLVHAPTAPDPNMLGLSWRTTAERDAKASGFAGKFVEGRQRALERYSAEAGDDDARLAAFYQLKLKENGALLAMLQGTADSADFMKQSTEAWVLLGKTIDTFEARLDGQSTYIVGDQIALADLHAGAYFARILLAAGATKNDASETALLDAQLPAGTRVGPKLKAYLTALFARESFQAVYRNGLH